MRSMSFANVRAALGVAMFCRLGATDSPSTLQVETGTGEVVHLTIPAGTVVRLHRGDLVLDTGTNPTER